MVRNGYTFDDWYTNKECENGQYNNCTTKYRDKVLTENTTIYAKWTPVAKANYTVVIWEQNIA